MGDNASTFAPFLPQREHLSRSSVCHSGTSPNVCTASIALNVRAPPQLRQVTFKAASKRMRSPVVRTCFVDTRQG
jgi:hypothetical protein